MQNYQGDIPIIQLNNEQLPKRLSFSPLKTDVIVAEGEAKGHYHKLQVKERDMVEIAQDQNGFYLKVNSGEAQLTHQQHGTQTIPQGIWFIGKQYEYDELKEVRRVLD